MCLVWLKSRLRGVMIAVSSIFSCHEEEEKWISLATVDGTQNNRFILPQCRFRLNLRGEKKLPYSQNSRTVERAAQVSCKISFIGGFRKKLDKHLSGIV